MTPLADPSVNSRRTLAFLIVVAVHVLLVWGFNAGLTDIMVEKVFGPMETEIIEEVKTEEEKPPPPPPEMEAPPPFVPPPEIFIDAAPVENTTAIQVTTTTRPVEAPPPAPVRQVARVNPKPGRNGLTQPEYPPSEKRAEHTGTVQLTILVLENGRVGDVKVHTSSGYPKLDEAAVAEAKRSWRFQPGTEDGKPVQMWVTVPIVFRLE
jgi:protein TonB